jgi:hypothetical protein
MNQMATIPYGNDILKLHVMRNVSYFTPFGCKMTVSQSTFEKVERGAASSNDVIDIGDIASKYAKYLKLISPVLKRNPFRSSLAGVSRFNVWKTCSTRTFRGTCGFQIIR